MAPRALAAALIVTAALCSEVLESVIRDKRYIDDVAASIGLVTCAQAVAAGSGACVLPNFFTDEAVQALREELLSADRVLSVKQHTVHQGPADDAVPPSHAYNRLVDAKMGFVPMRNLAPQGLLRTLYTSAWLKDAAASVFNRTLYHSEDANGAAYGIVNGEGYETAWHFDEHPVSAVLVLEAPESGGRLELVPGARDDRAADSRTSAAPAYAAGSAVERVLDGDRSDVESIAPGVGSLVFFEGVSTLHRVSPVPQGQQRVSAVFAWAGTPGFGNSGLVGDQNWSEAGAAGQGQGQDGGGEL